MTAIRLRCLNSHLFFTTVVAVLFSASIGCDTGGSTTNPRPGCPPNTPNCVGPTGGGVNPSGGGSSGSGGEGGSAATNDVTGNVGVLLDASFATVSVYSGASTIHSTSNSNMALEDPYGDMKSSFTLLDVKTGPTWFFVEDETVGATGIFSTHSVVGIPVQGNVTLPVVDRNVVTSIAGTLPTPIFIDETRGFVALMIVRNGQPLEGVSLTSSLPGATIAYDTGVGLYSNEVQQTGPAGVILAFNVDGPSASQLMDLTLTDLNQQSYFVQIRVQAATATFVGFEL